MNVIMNSLVIAVIARYPQLREDRTTLFMFSLSVSDLAAECTFMPISAALRSRATEGVADMVGYVPKIHAFTVWWFGFNSKYSLCLFILSKTIVILKLLGCEHLLTLKCCSLVIGVNWIIGCMLATANFKMNITWNTVMCTYRIPRDHNLQAFYMAHFVIGVVLPISIIICGALCIRIVAVRTHQQIAALEQSVIAGNSSIGDHGFVTAQAIVIVICVVSLALFFAFSALRNVTDVRIPDLFSFVSIWLFDSNTFINSLLYLLLFRSVRQKAIHMFCTMLAYICIR